MVLAWPQYRAHASRKEASRWVFWDSPSSFARSLRDKKRYVTSGYNGSIAISSLTYGDYKITISFIGYESLEKEVTVKAAKTSLGKLEMKPTSEMIESVVKEVQSLRTSQKGDTVSYNAGAFKVSNDADVEGPRQVWCSSN